MYARTNTAKRRTGATLIDVATGSMLLAVLMIPSLHLIGKSKSSNRRLAIRDALLFEADDVMENVKVALADPATFVSAHGTPVDRTQAIALSDLPNCVSRVRITADTSVAPAQLLTIDVEVWHDVDRDGSLDANESSESLRTQQAAP